MKKYLFLLAAMALLAAPYSALGSAPDQKRITLKPMTGCACGELIYGSARPTFCFVLCANGLLPCKDYTLIYYPDTGDWTGEGLICLGTATTDRCGRLRLQVQYTDELNIGDLPKEYDPTGAQIVLVLSRHVSCCKHRMREWQPEKYLFGEESITYDDTEDKITLSPDSPSVICRAKGLLKFNPDEDTFDFCFCASGLKPCQEYTLGIYDTVRMCLGSRKAYKNGNIKITGSVDTGDLEDAEIILVLSDDVDCTIPDLVAWNPDKWLFGDESFNFNDTND